MKIYLEDRHKEHIRKLGHEVPEHVEAEQHEYFEARNLWRETLQRTHGVVDEDLLHEKAVGHLVSKQAVKPVVRIPHGHQKLHPLLWVGVGLLLALLVPRAHCQFSHINTIQTKNQGSGVGFHASPFSINCSTNMTCADDGTTLTLSSSGGGAATGYQTIENAGTAIAQQVTLNWTAGIVCSNNAGASRSDCALAAISATSHKWFNSVVLGALVATEPASTDLADFSTTAPTTAGKIPIYDPTAPNAAGGTGAYVPGDPLVQGTQAAGSTTLPNPVGVGGSDYGGTPALRALKVDSSGNIYVGNFPATQPISAASLPLPTNAAQETGGNLAAIKTDVDKIPASPSTDRTTAAGPFSNQLSDGAAFYVAAKTGQLPAALDGSGFLKTHEQGTAAISGTVTATQATGSNLHMTCDSGCSSSAGFADSAAFTIGTTAINPIGGDFDDTPPTAITTGHAAAARITPNRAIHINLRNQAGTEIGTSSNPVRIDPTGTTTQPVSAASLPLPTGAAADSSLATIDTDIKAAQPRTQGAGSGAVGTYWYTRESDGTNAVVLDPCRTNANIFKPISQTASTQLVTGTSAKKIYICSINIVTAGANNIAMVEGTGTTCATGIAGMAGGSTAATGWNFAANGGLTQGNGMGSVMAEATNADNLCLLQSAAVQVSGTIGYVVQ